jgi:dUTP pyrophosphatase
VEAKPVPETPATTSSTPPADDSSSELLVHRLDPELPLPVRGHADDAGIDVYSAEDVELRPGARHLTGTGLAVRIPPGFVGLMHPRSGLAHKAGLSMVNTPGTIDAGYTGELKVNLINHDPAEPIHIRRGDRIAQLLIQRVELWSVREVGSVAELGESARGAKGFGSTGGHDRLG